MDRRCCHQTARPQSGAGASRNRSCCRSRVVLVLACVVGVALCQLAWFVATVESRNAGAGDGVATSRFNTAVHAVSERVEEVARSSWLHGFIQDLANATQTHHHVWRNTTIVFVHVPRTGGDSLRTHLFPSDDMWEDPDGTWWGPRGFPNFYASLRSMGHLNWYHPTRRAMYHGFVSGGDLRRLRDGPWAPYWRDQVSLFTVLRHPHERVLSVQKQFAIHNPVARGSLADFVRLLHSNNYERKYRSFINNSMAYQLGDQMDVALRTCSGEEAAQRACELLAQDMKYVAFFEDWASDYAQLRAAVFHDWQHEAEPQSSWWASLASWVRRELFVAGTWVARNRMRTRK